MKHIKYRQFPFRNQTTSQLIEFLGNDPTPTWEEIEAQKNYKEEIVFDDADNTWLMTGDKGDFDYADSLDELLEMFDQKIEDWEPVAPKKTFVVPYPELSFYSDWAIEDGVLYVIFETLDGRQYTFRVCETQKERVEIFEEKKEGLEIVI